MLCEMVAWFFYDEFERNWKEVVVISGLGQGQVADTCECGNEISGSIKCGKFLDKLRTG